MDYYFLILSLQRASPSLQVFRSRLKTELFARSYSCSDQERLIALTTT